MMRNRILYGSPGCLFSTIIGFVFAFSFALAGCGGGGGGESSTTESVTIFGKVDDGLPNSPVPNAQCSFIDQSGATLASANADQIGAFHIAAPIGVEGQINCNPVNLENLKIFSYSSTVGMTAGGTITDENVSPVTTVVTQKVYAENRPDKKEYKEELLRSIETLSDVDLALVARLSSLLYKAMLERNINVDYGGEGAGGDGGNGDGGGVGGDAGDGGDKSPIANARCEFIVSNDLKNANVLYSAALTDFKDDGIINRPDLKKVLEIIGPEFKAHKPEDIKAAFDKVFPSGIGHAYVDVTDENGKYFLKVPPDLPGFVRCFPPNQEKLILATYVPERQTGITLEDQDVNPATTIFSAKIATKLPDDLAATKDNYLADIAGLDVQILQDGGDVSGFQIRPGTAPTDKDVGLVAFSSTSLFNIFYKNGVNIDFLAALDDYTDKGRVDPVFLENTLGVPAVQANEFSTVVDKSVETTGTSVLGTDIRSALSKARLIVMVTDSPGGNAVPGATVDITGDISCDGCGTTTDSAGLVTLTLTGVPDEATDITVEASGIAGFAPAMATTEVVAFATVNVEIPLTITFPLSVQIGGGGSGAVASVPSGINCGSDCTQDYTAGTQVTLTAVPASGSDFSGWSGGGCTGIGPCLLTMSQAHAVTATFALTPQPPPDSTLTVNRAGTGSGTVTSVPSGINCGTDCTQDFIDGTQLTLTANPTSGSDFSGWSGGGCSGTAQCTLTMNQARTVTATFTLTPTPPPDFTLTVNRAGTGSGAVTSVPSGINCGTDCTQDYVEGTQVTLTANPTSVSEFSGWSGGGCTGTGQCTVTMNQARTVTANFTALFTLTVQGGSNGTGVVSSNPSGISCSINGTTESGDCSQAYSSNSRVTLTPDPSGSSAFSGWSGGGCTGTGQCTVTMDQARTVTANFTAPFTITIQGGSTGTGFVSSNPTGISCSINGTTESGDCSQAYSSNTQVTLTPDQSGGSTFTGWSGGGCSGTGQCTVTMNQAHTVTASFTLPPIPPTISNIRQQLVDSQFTCVRSDGSTFIGYNYRISVDYEDPNGDMNKDDGAVVRIDGADFQWYSITGDGLTGTASADPCYPSAQSDRVFSISVVDAAGLGSNSLSVTIP